MLRSHRRPPKKASRRPLHLGRRLCNEWLEDRRLLAVITVTTTADVLDGGTLGNPAGPDGKISLREAVNLANLSGGPDTIVLPTGNFKITRAGAGENANSTGDFDILDSVTIQAANGAKPTVSGNG